MSKSSDCQGPDVRSYLFLDTQSGGDIPESLNCPECHRGQAVILESEEWFYCANCEAAGDFVELLALRRGLPIEEAVAMALQANADSWTPGKVKRYLKQIADRQQVKQFWEQARQRPLYDISFQGRDLLHDLWMGEHVLSPRWTECESLVCGVAPLDAIKELPKFASESTLPEYTERITRSGAEEVVVIPHHDLPGRICGFSLLTGNLRTGSIEIAYRQVHPLGETGIACAGVIPRGAHSIWGNKLFVVDDPWLALHLHTQNFRLGFCLPPPLIAIPRISKRFREQTPWLLKGRDVVFCGSMERHYLMAKKQSGLISDYVPSSIGPFEWINHILISCQLQARPWQLALSDRVRGLPKEHVVKFIHSLGDPHPEERAEQVATMRVHTDDPPPQGASKNVGWAADPRRLQLPHFCICEDGSIEWTRFDQERHQTADDMEFLPSITDIPGFGLLPPMDDPKAVQMLSVESDAVSLVWALAACIVQHLTAQHGHDEEPMGIVLEEAAIHQVGRKLALALGCGQISIRERSARSVRRALEHYGEFHDFPCLVQGRVEDLRISKSWLRDPDLRRLVLPLTPSAARTLIQQSGFVRMSTPSPLRVTGSICDAARWIIPNYMTDFLGERKRFASNVDESIVLTILEDLAHWFEQQGGNPKVVRAATNFMQFAEGRCSQIEQPELVSSASTEGHDGSWLGKGPPRIV